MLNFKDREWLLLGLGTGIITVLIFLTPILDDLELLSYDYRLYIKSLIEAESQDDIVIVEIDKESLEEVGKWPWPRTYHANLIKELNQAGAKIIGFDILFDFPKERDEDRALAKQLLKSNKVVLPYILENKEIRQLSLWGLIRSRKLESGEIRYPIEIFKNKARGLGYLNLTQDSDGKVRRIDLIKEDLTPFAIKLAEEYNQDKRDFLAKELLINFHHSDTYFQSISFIKVLEGDYSEDFFKDKLVVVGATERLLRDYLINPFSFVKGYLPGVVIQAEIIDNYLKDSFIATIDDWLVVGCLVLFSLVTAIIYGRLIPIQGVNILVLSFIFMSLLGVLFLINFNLFIPITPFILISILNLVISNLRAYWQSEARKNHLQYTFSRYLSKDVIEKVINLPEKDYLMGERREISVLFIDLSGFTSFSEGKSSVEVVEILNKYLSLIIDEVLKFGGTLDKFLGDGAMVFFGAPTDQLDHAVCAIELALSLQSKVENNQQLPLPISIGINTGRAIVGNIGSTKRSDYTAIGDTVNTAARIEGLAKGGEILIGEGTYQQIEGKFKVKLKSQVVLRGKINKENIYEVIREESYYGKEF
ncbi:adenylate cyclase [Orenia metallireducens]|uniref:Adenylate cyclase n=1 Tax=Orenia metallireducens TaxID=1413210 RepID=A0A285GNY6_9FIRM|nr:adenylate/guanylate cyclase domain-containing protein [Orenia metallireducens]SNY25185.1 adenylate cyclase [Orenia metallireducens]